jgi:hypothetical protein
MKILVMIFYYQRQLLIELNDQMLYLYIQPEQVINQKNVY